MSEIHTEAGADGYLLRSVKMGHLSVSGSKETLNFQFAVLSVFV